MQKKMFSKSIDYFPALRSAEYIRSVDMYKYHSRFIPKEVTETI
jgi:hypothetical protein